LQFTCITDSFWNPGNAPSYLVAFVMLFFFVNNFGFSMIETREFSTNFLSDHQPVIAVTTPVMGDQWGLDVAGTTIVYMIGGAFTFTGVISLLFMVKLFGDRPITITVFILSIGAFFCMTDFQALIGNTHPNSSLFLICFNNLTIANICYEVSFHWSKIC
jgi:hypothetical protein